MPVLASSIIWTFDTNPTCRIDRPGIAIATKSKECEPGSKECEPAFHGTGTQDRLALTRIALLAAHRLSVFNFYSARDTAA